MHASNGRNRWGELLSTCTSATSTAHPFFTLHLKPFPTSSSTRMWSFCKTRTCARGRLGGQRHVARQHGGQASSEFGVRFACKPQSTRVVNLGMCVCDTNNDGRVCIHPCTFAWLGLCTEAHFYNRGLAPAFAFERSQNSEKS
eukprot:1147753-Pelagomonas_calceolata.AAC.9